MSIRIRPAQSRDLQSLAEFALALAQIHIQVDPRRFVLPGAGGNAFFFEFFRAELERTETALLIAEDSSTPVGYAFIRIEPANVEGLCETSAWLHDLYVDPQFRGRGVGRQLISAAIESAQHLGSSSLMLGVSPGNTQARQLYEQLGMRATMIEMRLDFV
jgi:ribosomal protein S18 acetylase RimI-like enzyme